MKLAYVLGEFPSLSETFILREMLELRRRGFELRIYALTRPAGDRAFACRGFACEARGRRQATPLPTSEIDETTVPFGSARYRPAFVSAASLAAILYFGLRYPGRLARAVWRTAAATAGHPRAMLHCLRNVPTAAVFARDALRFGAAHVHAHFASLPADVARMMSALMACEFSISAHAADIHLQPPCLLARKLRAARFVAVCTRYGAEEIRRRVGEGPANLHIIPHGVPRVDDVPSYDRGPLIVAVGRLQPKKGLATLVAACRILRDRGTPFRCVIAGEGPERRSLEHAIARAGLGDVVQMTGEQSQTHVMALLHEARVFALPCTTGPDGDRDGLPNAILEAMAAGVPVVATPVGGIPEAIDDGRTGLLVPPDNAEALATRLEELLKNEGLCRTLGLSGRALAVERFDIQRNVAPLAELLDT